MSTITDHYMDLKEIVTQEDGMVYVKYTEDELSGKAKKQESDFMKNLRRIWNEKSVSVLKSRRVILTKHLQVKFWMIKKR